MCNLTCVERKLATASFQYKDVNEDKDYFSFCEWDLIINFLWALHQVKALYSIIIGSTPKKHATHGDN